MKYFDAFSGIGGFAIPAQELGWECVGYSEIDKYAIQVYEKHFPSHRNFGNITKFEGKAIPDHDIFVGGFPCQAFSVAGKRRGFEDTRGTLFFDIARILEQKQPPYLLLENVKGLLSHDKGRTFGRILEALDELGYDCQWQVCNSKDFGVPQNRERVFIVGHFRGKPRPEVFPIQGTDGKDTRVIGEDVAYTIDANYHKGTNTLEKSRRSVVRQPLRYLNRNQKNIEGDYAFTVDASQTSGVRVKTVRTSGDRGKQKTYFKEGEVQTLSANPMSDNIPRVLNETEDRIRRLTPLECERLQGFPDGWTKGLSDTQRYKCLGNAVTVNVAREIMKRITN